MLAFAPIDRTADLAYTIVTALADLLAPLAGSSATVAAIVAFTVLVRLFLSPLSWAQSKGQKRQAGLASKLRDLQQRHANDPDRLQAETVALYRSEGAAPLAGCLPALAQAPFFLVMFRLFTSPTVNGHANTLLDQRLFGVPLSHRLTDGLDGAASAVFLGLFALLTLLAWRSARRFRAGVQPAAGSGAEPGPGPKSGSGSKSESKSESGAGGQPAVMGRILALLPYTLLPTAALVPLAAGVYLAATTAWTALEQGVIRRMTVARDRPPVASGQSAGGQNIGGDGSVW